MNTEVHYRPNVDMGLLTLHLAYCLLRARYTFRT